MLFKKISLLLFVSIGFSVSIFAQNKKLKLSAFHGVSINNSAVVYITKGTTQSVELEGDEDDIEDLLVEVIEGNLEIKNKSKVGIRQSEDVIVHITTNKLDFLSASGSGRISSKNQFVLDKLKVDVSGSGDIEFDVEAQHLKVLISGSGDLYLNGKAENARVKVSGSGELHAQELRVNTYNISVSGSGKCKINAVEEIDSDLTGSGSVYYKGDPKRVKCHTAGSGRLRKI